MTATATTPITTVSDRRARTEYQLSVKDGVTTAVQVSTHHDKTRKDFSTFANRVTITEDRTTGFTVTRSNPTDAVLVARIPVGRYSDKALLDMHGLALLALQEARDSDHKPVAALFA